LKLYELRREETMRKARDWYAAEFHAETFEEMMAIFTTDKGVCLRQLGSYWEMAAALVNQGAISTELFNATNGEHIGFFAKLEPFIPQIRATFNIPEMFKQLETLIDSTPDGRQKVAQVREMQKQMRKQFEQQAKVQRA